MISIYNDVGQFVFPLAELVFGKGTKSKYTIRRWIDGETNGKYFFCVRGKFFGKSREVAEFSMLVVATTIVSVPTLTYVESGFRSEICEYKGGGQWEALS